jgi:hypothetical protein
LISYHKVPKTSHSWPKNGMSWGEMSVVGFGGADPDDITYQLDILLTRKWARYWFDFLIQLLQVVSAAFSLYVPMFNDSLTRWDELFHVPIYKSLICGPEKVSVSMIMFRFSTTRSPGGHSKY